MHILVTGGAGYIGSHTCLALLEGGHRVTVPGLAGDLPVGRAKSDLLAMWEDACQWQSGNSDGYRG